jgi:hypothetical protein
MGRRGTVIQSSKQTLGSIDQQPPPGGAGKNDKVAFILFLEDMKNNT